MQRQQRRRLRLQQQLSNTAHLDSRQWPAAEPDRVVETERAVRRAVVVAVAADPSRAVLVSRLLLKAAQQAPVLADIRLLAITRPSIILNSPRTECNRLIKLLSTDRRLDSFSLKRAFSTEAMASIMD